MNHMQTYICTKLVRMMPLTRQAYNDLRGWELPADENGADEGYLVEYLDGGKPNVPGFDGYVSWSPKAQADSAYRPTTGMSFGLAIEALKKGKCVARAGWNGKGMWIGLHKEGGEFVREECGTLLQYLDYIVMKTADNKLVPWLASQTDMLADDWAIVSE